MNNLDELIKHYSYIVKYSLEDEAYVAKCVELGIMAHGDSQEEAIKEIKEATKVHLYNVVRRRRRNSSTIESASY